MKFFDPYAEIRATQHHLPHWQQPGAAYFITFRLADSLPEELLSRWKEERRIWLGLHPQPLSAEDEVEYHRLFSSRIDVWLDRGYGSCLLREKALRDQVEAALTFFAGTRYNPLSWILMPNHVHPCLVLHPDWLLEKILHSWKRHTSRGINRTCGTSGQLWMHDYFDRLIRDGDHLRNVIRYIRRNPQKARLVDEEYTLWESPLARAIE